MENPRRPIPGAIAERLLKRVDLFGSHWVGSDDLVDIAYDDDDPNATVVIREDGSGKKTFRLSPLVHAYVEMHR